VILENNSTFEITQEMPRDNARNSLRRFQTAAAARVDPLATSSSSAAAAAAAPTNAAKNLPDMIRKVRRFSIFFLFLVSLKRHFSS
jgi:hypothetical protein